MTLRWHIWLRGDYKPAEYATDEEDKERKNPLFLIDDECTLYEADQHEIRCEGIECDRIVWEPVWQFDELSQAREEARIRHKSKIKA